MTKFPIIVSLRFLLTLSQELQDAKQIRRLFSEITQPRFYSVTDIFFSSKV